MRIILPLLIYISCFGHVLASDMVTELMIKSRFENAAQLMQDKKPKEGIKEFESLMTMMEKKYPNHPMLKLVQSSCSFAYISEAEYQKAINLQEELINNLSKGAMDYNQVVLQQMTGMPDKYHSVGKYDFSMRIGELLLGSVLDGLGAEKKEESETVLNRVQKFLTKTQNKRFSMVLGQYCGVIAKAALYLKKYKVSNAYLKFCNLNVNMVAAYVKGILLLNSSKNEDLRKGMTLIQKSAQAGMVEACFDMARRCLRGLKVQENHGLAHTWFTISKVCLKYPNLKLNQLGALAEPKNLLATIEAYINMLQRSLSAKDLERSIKRINKIQSNISFTLKELQKKQNELAAQFGGMNTPKQ